MPVSLVSYPFSACLAQEGDRARAESGTSAERKHGCFFLGGMFLFLFSFFSLRNRLRALKGSQRKTHFRGSPTRRDNHMRWFSLGIKPRFSVGKCLHALNTTQKSALKTPRQKGKRPCLQVFTRWSLILQIKSGNLRVFSGNLPSQPMKILFWGRSLEPLFGVPL